jgi:hypothetical protein
MKRTGNFDRLEWLKWAVRRVMPHQRKSSPKPLSYPYPCVK